MARTRNPLRQARDELPVSRRPERRHRLEPTFTRHALGVREAGSGFSGFYDSETERAKYLDPPLGRYARVQTDAVLHGDRRVGLSNMCGYTVNARAWMSVAMIEPDIAVDGQEVVLLWGEENGGTSKLAVESHRQRPIRATVHTTSLVK